MLRRLLALGPWLAEGKHVWAALAVVLVAMLICFRPGASEPLIRLTGLGLQILGVGTAVWGILATRKYFGQASPIAMLVSWLKRCPLRGTRVVASIGTARSRSSAGKLRGYSSAAIDPKAESEVRIEALEKNIGLIHERITFLARDIDGDVSILRGQVERESKERAHLESQVNSHIEGVATGGLHITAIGAVWLFLGVLLSTASSELSRFLQ